MGDAIYALANGKGKKRMSGETLKNVEPASWLLNIISSGEISMQERLRDGGETVKGDCFIAVLTCLSLPNIYGLVLMNPVRTAVAV
jgi:hypothetical protein